MIRYKLKYILQSRIIYIHILSIIVLLNQVGECSRSIFIIESPYFRGEKWKVDKLQRPHLLCSTLIQIVNGRKKFCLCSGKEGKFNTMMRKECVKHTSVEHISQFDEN